ncbi:MAG TPA: TerC family protein [Chloroflexota bacterium]|nr:TerC family protein [Chloroflexota bacterium]
MEISGEVVSRVVQIVLIDLVLSADNAVVIGMAAHPLPPHHRRMAILVGGGVAILLRVVLTGVAAVLLGLPALKAIGGLLLLWIAYRLLAREGAANAGVRAASTLRAAITTILVADVVMSLDNVLGVAAASGGDIALLIFGLLVSMAIVMFGGGLFADLIDRLWWLAYFGAAVIAWTGAEMIQEDALVSGLAELPLALELSVNALVTVVVVGLAHVVHRRQPALRRSAQ